MYLTSLLVELQHEKKGAFSVFKVIISVMSMISRSSPGSPTMTWRCLEL